MDEQLSVLILGLGGHVSQGILKALAASSLPLRVVGACVSPLARGLYLTSRAYVSPLAADPQFLDWLMDVCRSERIDAVLSGVEPNLVVMAEHAEKLRAQTGAVCIVSRPAVLAIGDDKLMTCQRLEANGLNYPRYAACSDPEAVMRLVSECGYPLIAKPRSGRGGIGVLKVSNRAGLEYALSHADYVLEECLGSEDSEYTVGCFTDQDGCLRGTIAMRRELQHGTTCRAELGVFPEVSAEAARIARALRPMGPLNVQLRISDGRPVCFEWNVRFSGTTSLRSAFGWNDVEAALRHYVLGEPACDLPSITQGGVAIRYWDEIYVDQRAFDELRSSSGLSCPGNYVQSGYAYAHAV